MKGRSGGTAPVSLGWATIAFWLSMSVFPQPLPPLGPWPHTGNLVHAVYAAPGWIRELAGLDQSEREAIASLDRELLATYARAWLVIAIGVVSGVLLVLRRRAGRVLAIALCAALLGSWLVHQAGMLLDPEPQFRAYWTVTPRVAPSTFVSWVVRPVFYAVSLGILALGVRRSANGDTVAANT